MAQRLMTAANFILHFGPNKELLDFFDEVVGPAFLKPVHRKSGSTQLVFLDTKLVSFGIEKRNPILGIAGRLVRDTILTRQQILENGQLVPSPRRMPSAPSAYFVLLLNNHKLIYLSETAHSPSLQAFERAALWQLRRAQGEFLKKQQKIRQSEERKKVKLKDLEKLIPRPSLEVIPLSTNKSIKQFLHQYKKLSSVELKLVKPNDEADFNSVSKRVRKLTSQINGDLAVIRVVGKQGLDISATADRVASVIGSGNAQIKFSGHDKAGLKLDGNSDHIKLYVPVDLAGLGEDKRAEKLYEVFEEHIAPGLPASSLDGGEKSRQIVSRIAEGLSS